MPYYEEFGFKVGPISWVKIHTFSASITNESLSKLEKPMSEIEVVNKQFCLVKEVQFNLETKLPKVRDMPKLRFFYLSLPNSLSKLALLNVCVLHMSVADKV